MAEPTPSENAGKIKCLIVSEPLDGRSLKLTENTKNKH